MLWVRHGTSRGNVRSALEFFAEKHPNALQRSVARDLLDRVTTDFGSLTPLGRQQARAAGAALARARVQPPQVLASCLPRAIETAHHLLAGLGRAAEAVVVVPHVQELRNPSRPRREVEAFAARAGIPVDMRYYEDLEGGDPPDLGRFYDLVRRRFPDPVLVVSHGNFMEDVKGPGTPNNTEMWYQPAPGTRATLAYRPPLDPFLGGVPNIGRLMTAGLLA